MRPRVPWRLPISADNLHSLYLLRAWTHWPLRWSSSVQARFCLRASARAMSAARNAFPQVVTWLTSSPLSHSGLWSTVTFSVRPSLPTIPSLSVPLAHFIFLCTNYCHLVFWIVLFCLSPSIRRQAPQGQQLVSPASRIIPGIWWCSVNIC